MVEDIYKLREQIVKSLAHSSRLKILNLLQRDGEKCVCDIVKEIGADQSTISKHLAVLKSSGIIEKRKEGLKSIYRISTPCVMNFLDSIDGVLKQDFKAKSKVLK